MASISLSVGSSVATICQTLEQTTQVLTNEQVGNEAVEKVAGHVGRAAAVFRVQEVIVVDEASQHRHDTVSYGAGLLARLLQYQETPQYLRKYLIPIHEDYRAVGSLPPLDAPHHQRASEWTPFREGCVIECGDLSSLVDVGLDRPAKVQMCIPVGRRVTLNMSRQSQSIEEAAGTFYPAKVCDPQDPKRKKGLYWGFTVRIAQGMSAVFLESPYACGYDCVIGTSEHGDHIPRDRLKLPNHEHLLILFGGPAGLEEACSKDLALKGHDIRELCHYYLNTCPSQGSRTIRTEEAIWISLSYLSSFTII